MFARPILIEHTDADTEHVYFFDFHRRLRLSLSRFLFLRRKMFQIIQIPGPRSCAFIPAQGTDPDVMKSQET